MRVNAVISGQAGVALLVDGPDVASIYAGRPGEVVRRSRAEARFLLGDAQDLQFLEDVELEEVGRRLELASAQVDALHIALILLSGSAAHDTRRDAAEELEEFLANDEVSEFLERIFFSHPLPRGADLPGAHSSCTGRTDRTRSFLGRLGSLQSAITAVYFAWEGIPTEVFGTEENQAAARAAAIRKGLFRDVVRNREKKGAYGSVLPEHLARLEWNAVPHGEAILSYWLSTLASEEPERGIEETQPELSAQPVGLVSEVREGSATTRATAETTDPEAELRFLVDRDFSAVTTFFSRIGLSPGQSADLAQETFLRVYRELLRFRGEVPSQVRILSIAFGVWREELRQRRVVTMETDSAPFGDFEAEEREERLRRLRAALEELPPGMRRAVELRLQGDLKDKEIAALMKISIGTVKAQLSQAQDRLAETLGDLFDPRWFK